MANPLLRLCDLMYNPRMQKGLLILILLLFFPGVTYAHPGRTDGNGGHTCRTNCEKWGESYGGYHYHNGGTSAPPVQQVAPAPVITTAPEIVAPEPVINTPKPVLPTPTSKPTSKPTVKPTQKPALKPSVSPSPVSTPSATPNITAAESSSASKLNTTKRPKKSSGFFSWFWNSFRK